VTALLSTAALALLGCGGGNGGPSASDREKFEEAALKHAQCLRKHGIDAPDPKVNGGRIEMSVRAGKGNEAALQQAEKACSKYLANLPRPKMNEKQAAEEADRALAHARCMRKEGINIPDPKIDPRGGVLQRVPNGVSPDDPAFQAAEKKCGGGMKMMTKEP
jgi:hypothetical protein